MKCDRAGHLLTTDAMSAAQTLRKLACSAGLSRPDPATSAKHGWEAPYSVSMRV
jgi:hypothetical protein